jgi:uncharacterized protein (TIGR02453 family)
LRTSGFAGFPPEAMKFLAALAKNNRREWFQPRKELYETTVRRPMLELVSRINGALLEFAPDYICEPEKAVFRIYRDTRFSPDKTPYKTHIAAVFHRRGLNRHEGAAYYFSVSPNEVSVGGGAYMPSPEVLLAIRSHIAVCHGEFAKLVSDRTVRKYLEDLKGESLSRAPKGFNPSHPAADYIRMKQWFFYTTLHPRLAVTSRLLPEIVKRFRLLTPFIEFMNRPFAGRRKVLLEELEFA